VHALVVDDSRAMRMILRRTLVKAGFEVTEAADGQQALDAVGALAAAGTLPAVALVDWNMPVMDGLEFIKAVRRNREWRSISLMMVTTESEHANIVRALAAGAHEYVLKPFGEGVIEDKLALLGLCEPATS
jgi:two-component system chemotaxis response regulator CheY